MNRRTPTLAVLATALVAFPALAGPALTLYTSDLGLVKETRRVEMRGGRDTLRLEGVSNRLDASSLRIEPGSGRLARLAYRWDVATGDGLLGAAAGIVRGRRRFNERMGWTPALDTLPPRLLDGEGGIGSETLAGLVAAYERRRGWGAG